MYAKIVPVMRLPRKLENFDYLIPDKLKEKIKLGQIVEIPFRNSQKNGIIFSIHNENPSANLKNILRIIEREPILNDAQIKLVMWASFYYCCSPAVFFKNIIPEIPAFKKSRHCLVPATERRGSASPLLKILKSEIPKIQKILKKISENKKTLLQWNNYYNKTAIYIKLLEKLSKDKQVILIFPQLSDLEKFLFFLPSKLKANTSILHSEITKKKHYQEWEIIKNKNNGIIIGTRQAIFAPVKNLGLIIIDNEENISHKQWDQNPRYHTLTIAKKLQEMTDAKILLASNTPSAETYYISKKETYEIIFEDDDYASSYKNIKVAQMQDEWNKKNYSILSEDAIDSIQNNINFNKNSLIYINRRGASQLVICKDCGYIPMCPKCNLALTLHSGKENILKCHHCEFTKKLENPCPKCNGFNMKLVGTGTEKAEKILKELFKNIKIIRVDTDIKKGEIREKLLSADSKIIIATNAILSYVTPPDIASCIFLNIDTNMNIPSFRAFENTAQVIKNLSLMLDQDGKLIIQSYGNIKETLPFLKENFDFTKYYNNIIEERKNTNYPPFSQLIKLTFKNKDVKIIKFETDKLFDVLNKELGKNKNISLLGPIALPAQRNNYINEIIIKNKGGAIDLQKWLTNNVPQEWIIDIDPIEI